jgi:opacity protein-like surface antigen
MKTLTKFLSIAVIASGSLFAGGGFVPTPEPDVEPVEPAIAEIPEAPAPKNIQPYFGGAIGSSSAKVNSQAKVCGGCQFDKLNQTSSKAPDKVLKWGGSDDAATGMVLAGVEINDYLAVEGRLTKAISDYEIKDHKPISFYNAALYLKPQYKFEFGSIYALLGYGYSSFKFMGKTTSDTGFQYGVGGTYDVTDDLSAFADYTKLYSGDKKLSDYTKSGDVDSVNVGVIFKP